MNGNTKQCETCGGTMIRPRWKNGKLDSTWKKGKYCSSKCYGKANMKANPNLATIRKRDQRSIKTEQCEECGLRPVPMMQQETFQTKNQINKQCLEGVQADLQRHHVGRAVKILCQKCHTKEQRSSSRSSPSFSSWRCRPWPTSWPPISSRRSSPPTASS